MDGWIMHSNLTFDGKLQIQLTITHLFLRLSLAFLLPFLSLIFGASWLCTITRTSVHAPDFCIFLVGRSCTTKFNNMKWMKCGRGVVLCPDVHAHRQRTPGGLSYISCHRGMSNEGVTESIDCANLTMQLSEILDTPFCTTCRVALPSSSQRCSLS